MTEISEECPNDERPADEQLPYYLFGNIPAIIAADGAKILFSKKPLTCLKVLGIWIELTAD